MHFDFGLTELNCFKFEVDADGGDIVILKLVLAKLCEEVGFADPSISDYDDLGEIIVVGTFDHEIFFF